MPEQYVASDKRTGLEVAVTGEFPPKDAVWKPLSEVEADVKRRMTL